MFEDATDEPETGWGHVAAHDDAPAVIDTLLGLDPEATYTKTELSDEAGVTLKSLYLDGTLDHLVAMGFLQKHADEGEEILFSVDTETAVFEAAAAFEEVIAARLDEE
jgi:Fe2+ or Zn2+ uptake regulation protein